MVLQSNFAKRIDTENTPPSTNKKSVISRLRSSLHDATGRRRRARASGSRSPKYLVEQAKRRSATKSSPSSVRLNVEIPNNDVKMADPPSSSSQAAGPQKTVPFEFVRQLTRPDYCEIANEALTAIDPDLESVDIDFFREKMKELGPALLYSIATAKANPVKDALPKELPITVQDIELAPTHMVAVHANKPPAQGRRRHLTLYPVHDIILALYCSKLPPFPPTVAATSVASRSPKEITLPVRSLSLPAPHTYPQLLAFLYTKRKETLLKTFFPCPPPPTIFTGDQSAIRAFSKQLGDTYTVQIILQSISIVHSHWRNVCYLGIFDDDLWETLDLAWEVLLNALAVGTGCPDAMVQQAPESPLQTQNPSTSA